MPWTYSGDPSSSVKDAIRFEIQDTDSSAPLLEDAEIDYAITKEAPNTPPSEGELWAAAVRCCEALSRRFAAQADTQTGSLQVTYSKQAETYAKRARELRVRASGSHAPWTGGTSEAEKQALRSNTDRVQPVFSRDRFSNPWARTGATSGLPTADGN